MWVRAWANRLVWGAIVYVYMVAAPAQAQPLPQPPPPAPERGYLGMSTDDRPDKGKGLRVVNIRPGSPAEKAGVQVGDLLVAAGGTPVRQNSDLAGALQNLLPGDRITLDVVRGEQTLGLEVRLGRRPPPGVMGIISKSHVDGVRQLQGALIVQVEAGLPAQQAGLKPGDLIVAVDNEPIADNDSLAAQLAGKLAGDKVAVSYYRGIEFQNVTVTLSEDRPPPAANGRADVLQRIEQLERQVRELQRQIEELKTKIKG